MKKVVIRLSIYLLIIALAVIIFSYTHRSGGMFTMYNIMNGLAYGGLAVIVFCGFLGKKGDKVVVNFMSMPSIGRGAATFGTGVNLAYSTNPDLMMKAEKPQLETKKTYIDAPKKEDSRLLKITLFLLPYIIGIGSMAVGVIYLIR
ncbi:MAG: hypothetical protein IJO47_08565 [Clostridia bacterium]|nr:hypothetical protein [Clostridia bacterium]